MNIFSITKLNLLRNTKRSILLLFTFVTFSTLIFTNVMFVQSTSQISNQVRRSMPAVVSVNRKNATYTLNDISEIVYVSQEFLSHSVISDIANSPFVRSYEFAKFLNAIIYEWSSYGIQSEFEFMHDIEKESLPTMTSIIGVSSYNVSMIEYGMKDLVAGRTFLIDEMNITSYEYIPVLISYPLAIKNNVWIDDVVNKSINYLYLPNDLSYINYKNISERFDYYNLSRNSKNFKLKIVGIFDLPPLSNENQEEIFRRYELLNRFITPLKPLDEIFHLMWYPSIRFSETFGEYSRKRGLFMWTPEQLRELLNVNDSFFIMYDLAHFEELENFAAFYLPENWYLNNFFGSMPYIYHTLSSIHSLSTRFLIFSISSGIMILSLIITLLIRNKKKEIAILTFLGQTKFKCVFNIISELMVIAVIGILIGYFISTFFAPNLSQNLILNEMYLNNVNWKNFVSFDRNSLIELGFGRAIDFNKTIENVTVNIDLNTMFISSVILIITILISTVVPLIYLFEQNHKEFLNEGKIG